MGRTNEVPAQSHPRFSRVSFPGGRGSTPPPCSSAPLASMRHRSANPQSVGGPFLSALAPPTVIVEDGGQIHTCPLTVMLLESPQGRGEKGGRGNVRGALGQSQCLCLVGRAAHVFGEDGLCISRLLGQTGGQGQYPWATNFLSQASSTCRVNRNFSWSPVTGSIPGLLSGFPVLIFFRVFGFSPPDILVGIWGGCIRGHRQTSF